LGAVGRKIARLPEHILGHRGRCGCEWAGDTEHFLAPDKLDVASTNDENQQVNVKLRAGLLILALVAVVAGRPTVVQAFGVPRAN